MAKISNKAYQVRAKGSVEKVNGGDINISGVRFNGYSKEDMNQTAISLRDIMNDSGKKDEQVRQEAKIMTGATMAPEVISSDLYYKYKNKKIDRAIKKVNNTSNTKGTTSASVISGKGVTNHSASYVRPRTSTPVISGKGVVNRSASYVRPRTSTPVMSGKGVINCSASYTRSQTSTPVISGKGVINRSASYVRPRISTPVISSMGNSIASVKSTTTREELMRKCGVVSSKKLDRNISKYIVRDGIKRDFVVSQKKLLKRQTVNKEVITKTIKKQSPSIKNSPSVRFNNSDTFSNSMTIPIGTGTTSTMSSITREELMRKCGVVSKERMNENVHKYVQDARRHVAISDDVIRKVEPKVCSVAERKKIEKQLKKTKKKLGKNQNSKRKAMAKKAMIRNAMIKNAMNPESEEGTSGVGTLLAQFLKKDISRLFKAVGSKIIMYIGAAFGWILSKIAIISIIIIILVAPIAVTAYIIMHPISFFIEGIFDSDVVEDEEYLNKVLLNKYEEFNNKIEKFTDPNNGGDEDNEVEYKKNTGESNFNDVAAIYLSMIFDNGESLTSVTGDSNKIAPYLNVDTYLEKNKLQEIFEQMNYTETEDIETTVEKTEEKEVLVYNPVTETYETNMEETVIETKVSVKKMTVYTLSLQEWKDIYGTELSEEELALLDTLGEFVSATISGGESGGEVGGIYVGDIVTDGQVNPFYVYSQTDSRWGSNAYFSSTLREGGCGPSACAMVISSLTGRVVDPPAVASWATKNGQYYVAGKGSTYSLIGDACKAYGLKVQRTTRDDISTIQQALKDGKLCICIMGPGDFTSGGHFIVLRGITSDGLILVGDSAGSSGRRRMSYAWDINKVMRQVRAIDGGGVWIISK